MVRLQVGIACLVWGLFAAAALAQSDPLGLQFVTVGSPGNPAYQSANPNDFVNGRGSVNYSFRISPLETTTAQWASFFNAAFDRPAGDSIPFVDAPLVWGAVGTTPINPGGQRWTVPNGNGMLPVGGISWRTAAVFCNWLDHGANPNALRTDFLSGAYDVSTFGYNGNIFTDQLAHTPGSQYWIPTWDEWLKAAHWSPSNPNNNGWYQYSNSSDSAYVYGPPGAGTANAGDASSFNIPLGSYSAQSPWGLFDVAGETTEWTESIRTIDTGERFRMTDGSFWGESSFESNLVDQVRSWGSDELPHVNSYEYGLRLASAVPAPGACAVGVGALLYLSGARRRQDTCQGRSEGSSQRSRWD
jgi:formylglycine-generating enzyme required for sulfatase activity